MAGGINLNAVEYPPLIPINQKQTIKTHLSSIISQDRDQNIPAATFLHPPNLATEARESMDIVVGSLPIPTITLPLETQFAVQSKNNREVSKPPPSSLTPSNSSGNQIGVTKKGNTHTASQNLGKDSNLALCFKGSFPCKPIHKILDKPCISFDSKDKTRLIANMGHIVVVKFTHLRPKYSYFKTFLHKLKFQGAYKIIEFDYKHIFIDFVVFEDCIKLWILKSIVVGGFRGRLFMWDADFKPSIESPYAPIWIHLPHFPLYLFDEHAMLSVASLFGKPVHIENSCLGHDKVGVMSFCVFKDVRVQGPSEFYVEFVGEGIMVERFMQVVLYGSIPDYCSYCLHMGHNLDVCKVMLEAGSREQDEEVEISAQAPHKAIPLPSVFNRIQLDLKVGARKHMMEVGLEFGKEDSDRVDTVVQTHEEVLADGPLSQGRNTSLNPCSDNPKGPSSCKHISVPISSGKASLAGDSNTLSKVHADAGKEVVSNGKEPVLEGGKTVDASLNFPDNSTAPSSKPNLLISRDGEQYLLMEAETMMPKVDVRAEDDMESDGKADEILGKSSADASLNISDSSTTPFSKSHMSTSGDGEQDFLLEKDPMISKVDSRASKLMVTCGEVPVLSGRKAADEPHNSVAISVSSTALTLEHQNSHPEAVMHDSKAGDNCLISKVFVPAFEGLETTREDHDFVAETSVVEPLAADQILSMPLNSSFAGTSSTGSLEGTFGDVLRWLGKNVGKLIQDNLQQQAFDHGGKVKTSKVVIKHPVTKEIVHLSPKSTPTVSNSPKSLMGLSKNAKKKLKKKQKKLDLQNTSISTEVLLDSDKSKIVDATCPLPICVSSQQDWDGLDINGSKDSAFWANYHAAQADLSLIARPEEYPFMFVVDSDEDRLSSSSGSLEKFPSSSSDTSQEQLDHIPLLEAYHKGHFDVQSPSQEPPASPKDSTPLSFEELAGVSIKAKDTQTPCDEVTKTSKKNTTGPSTSSNSIASKVSHSTSASKTTKPFIPSLGVQVTVKTKVKETDDNIKEATNHKVPKELFFFPPRPSTPAGVTTTYASKKFNKEFLKPP